VALAEGRKADVRRRSPRRPACKASSPRPGCRSTAPRRKCAAAPPFSRVEELSLLVRDLLTCTHSDVPAILPISDEMLLPRQFSPIRPRRPSASLTGAGGSSVPAPQTLTTRATWPMGQAGGQLPGLGVD